MPAQVGVLNDIFGIPTRAEHAVSDSEQAGSIRFEDFCGSVHGVSRLRNGRHYAPRRKSGLAPACCLLALACCLDLREEAHGHKWVTPGVLWSECIPRRFSDR